MSLTVLFYFFLSDVGCVVFGICALVVKGFFGDLKYLFVAFPVEVQQGVLEAYLKRVFHRCKDKDVSD